MTTEPSWRVTKYKHDLVQLIWHEFQRLNHYAALLSFTTNFCAGKLHCLLFYLLGTHYESVV